MKSTVGSQRKSLWDLNWTGKQIDGVLRPGTDSFVSRPQDPVTTGGGGHGWGLSEKEGFLHGAELRQKMNRPCPQPVPSCSAPLQSCTEHGVHRVDSRSFSWLLGLNPLLSRVPSKLAVPYTLSPHMREAPVTSSSVAPGASLPVGTGPRVAEARAWGQHGEEGGHWFSPKAPLCLPHRTPMLRESLFFLLERTADLGGAWGAVCGKHAAKTDTRSPEEERWVSSSALWD